MRKRKLVIAAASGALLTVGSLAFGATASAAPSTPPVFKACVADRTGDMRQVSAGTTRCPRGQHLIAWNQVGPTGATGKTGAQGPTGPIGPQGPAGIAGLAGTKIFSGIGLAAADTFKTDANEGDFYLDVTPGSTALYTFDGTDFTHPVTLTGDKGGTGATGQQGPKGTDGKSVSVKREAVATPAANGNTMTLNCDDNETAIGGGAKNLPPGVSLVNSTVGNTDEEWVLEFSNEPTGATATVICAAIS